LVDEVKIMASDSGLQQVIGAALIESAVLKALIRDPLSLADRFGLTLAERRFVAQNRPRDLEHFASMVEGWTNGRPPVRRAEDALYLKIQRVG
jgi:hypothetical protein